MALAACADPGTAPVAPSGPSALLVSTPGTFAALEVGANHTFTISPSATLRCSGLNN